MKCKNCGHLNKSNTYYCEKCGSSLESSNAIREYKQSKKYGPETTSVFTKTQKFIIALVIVGILIVVLSAVIPPDMEMPSLAAPGNLSSNEPTQISEEIANKLNTTIKVGSISAKTGEKVTVNAYVSDENGNPVKTGTVSINLFDIKYSGQVENGNGNVVLPELSENNYETTMVYEGNDQYNPSETKVTIEVNKENTKIEAEARDDEIKATLKSEKDKIIPNAKIIITKADNTQMEQKTDVNGQIRFKLDEPGKQTIKLSYSGDEKHNPSEITIEAGKEKIGTKLDTKYDEKTKTVTITLMDKDNHKISGATLIIINNNQETHEKTDSEGTVKIPVNVGENNILIKYEGNDTYQNSETTINTVVKPEQNQTDNQTDNQTKNQTNNNTNNDTINKNNTTDDTTNNNTENTTDNSTENKTEAKTDTQFKIKNENNETTLTLLTKDNQIITGETIKIIYDNGTEITEKTDSQGKIELNINETTKEIKIIYEGNDKYNSFQQNIQFNTRE